MAWDATKPATANNVRSDVGAIQDNFEWLDTELAHEHDWTTDSGEHLGGSARALQAAVAYSDAGLAIAGTAAAADAAQASPYTDRRLLIDSVGRQYYYDDVAAVWKPLCSPRISRTSSNAAATSGVLAGSPTWVNWDAANLDITKTIDDTSGDWIEKVEFHDTFLSDGAASLEVRIYDNTAGAVVAAAQKSFAAAQPISVDITAYYRPVASAATTFKVQVSGSAGRTFTRSAFLTTATVLYGFFSVSEVPA